MSSVLKPTGDSSDTSPSVSEIGSSGGDAQPLSQDIAFEMLSCKRRRDVLHYLRQHGGDAELRPLSRQIAAWENDVPVEAVTYEERARVYTALRQGHLPKLDGCDIVEYDANRGTVTLTERASNLDVYLDVVPHDDISWSAYYTGLGGLSVAFAAFTLADTFPFGLLPAGGGALIVGVLLLGSAVAHRLYERRMRVGGDGQPPG
ncbi:DUF7344 domain-containing protein [Natronoarchaeum philippinense]|uniref:DUF7344 domain-containing protein n=1 Tax=Natronoarchaeum philippinense TaxID=558529 RepID=UPI001C53C54D|nr:hypothetical protein [Natronoarchaeum philippinense]